MYKTKTLFCIALGLLVSIVHSTMLQAEKLTDKEKQELVTRAVDSVTQGITDKDAVKTIQELTRIAAEAAGVTPEAIAKDIAGKVIGGPGELLADIGIMLVTDWMSTHGTSVQRIINNTPYYFMVFTRNIGETDTRVKKGKYDLTAAINRPGSTIVPPGARLTFPDSIFKSQNKKEFVIAVVACSDKATAEQRAAFDEGRLPAALTIVDTGKEQHGLCGSLKGKRVRLELYAITGPKPDDRKKLECLWACGRRKAKRLEIILERYDALTGTPEGKWTAPSTLMNYRIKMRQTNDNGWKAKYTNAAPKGKTGEGC